MASRAIVYPHKLRRWHAGHDAKHPDLDCGLCREAGWFVPREQVDELVQAAGLMSDIWDAPHVGSEAMSKLRKALKPFSGREPEGEADA